MSYRCRPWRIAVSSVLVLVLVFSSLFAPFFTHTSHAVIKEIKGNGGDYTDNAYVAQRLDVVFSEFPVGSYFSYTGGPCTCHNKCSYVGGCDCISDYNDPEKNGQLVRLYSCQCMGFAHYMFYKLFGFVDRSQNYPDTADKYYSLGSLSPSEMTVANVKNLFKNVKTGANVRTTGKHSFIVLSTDDNGMYIYHANTGIPCRVDSWYWTWEELTATYKSYGIQYVHLPTDYPESTGTYVPPAGNGGPSVPKYQTGQVRVNTESGLRLRVGAGTDTEKLDLIPHATLLTVTELKGEWGKVQYNGKIGWIFLEYTQPVLSVSVPKDRFYSYDGVPVDLSSVTVTQLQADMSKKILPAASYSLSYSSPESGQYTATITAGDSSVSFPMEVLPFGDLNADKSVTAADASILVWAAAGEISLTARQKEGADIDGNGTVNRDDAVAIISYLTGNAPAPGPRKTEG